jgi:hypothetical protein
MKEDMSLKLIIHMVSWICEDALKKEFSHSDLSGRN